MSPSSDRIPLEIDLATRLSDAVGRWPRDRPLAMLASHAGDDDPSRDAVFLAAPTRRDELRGPDTFDALRSLLGETPAMARTEPSIHPSGRGHLVMLSYDLFRGLEPTAIHPEGARDDRAWPDAVVLRCDGGHLLQSEGIVGVGDPAPIPPPGPDGPQTAEIGPLTSGIDRPDYERIVADVVERIHRGDCFQANLAQRFTASYRGTARAVALAAFAAGIPRHGAMLECGDGRTVISMSPELFLDVRPTKSGRRVATGPIKGTRPASAPVEELLHSEKDAAELAMIVDLMRNDLGRVCDIGSISVDCPRRIETHRTVHHGVAHVSGTLRDDVDVVDLLRGTFPPGSITGAPKVQAMRIIDELEPVRRGPYCGSIGWIDDEGWSRFNVAIRTIMCSDPVQGDDGRSEGRLDYIAGCGIVAESDPASEWRESLDKTAVLRNAITHLAETAGPSV